ncbi:MAG: hypothetical protein EPN91_05410 [Salinibacterium sp.]|nr:MAG: hypothetical protein EPN91_05410 [Salinibacterium sp.]
MTRRAWSAARSPAQARLLVLLTECPLPIPAISVRLGYARVERGRGIVFAAKYAGLVVRVGEHRPHPNLRGRPQAVYALTDAGQRQADACIGAAAAQRLRAREEARRLFAALRGAA